MRKYLFLILLVTSKGESTKNPQSFDFEIKERRPVVATPIEIKPKGISNITSDSLFVNALIIVESQGRDSIIGDRHLVGNEAVGALQIRPIMVREVNRILKLKKSKIRFKLKDRFSREKSVQMFRIWKEFHHKDSDFEKIARNWNGGPKGYKISRTAHYWAKVQKELEVLN